MEEAETLSLEQIRAFLEASEEDIDRFYQRDVNPYLNSHRPCEQPEQITDPRGKEKLVYRRYATPWEVLRELSRALPQAKSYLKPGLSIQALDRFATAHSDAESARHMQAAKRKLFLAFQQERKSA
jgi:hypothetical protein